MLTLTNRQSKHRRIGELEFRCHGKPTEYSGNPADRERGVGDEEGVNSWEGTQDAAQDSAYRVGDADDGYDEESVFLEHARVFGTVNQEHERNVEAHHGQESAPSEDLESWGFEQAEIEHRG
jgi:hypothetical protein